MSRILLFLIIILFTFFSVAVTDVPGLSQTFEEPVKVGIDPSFRPFAFRTHAKKLAGLDLDFLNRLGDSSNLTFWITEIPQEDIFASLAGNRIHIAFIGMAGTVDEEPEILLSEEYYIIPDAVVTNVDKVTPEDVKDLEKRILSFPAEMGYDSFIRSLNPTDIIPSNNFFEVLDNVMKNLADAAIIDKRLAEDIICFDEKYSAKLKIAFELRLPDRGLVLAAHRSNTSLMGKVNQGIEELSRDSAIDLLERKWFRKVPAFLPTSSTYGD